MALILASSQFYGHFWKLLFMLQLLCSILMVDPAFRLTVTLGHRNQSTLRNQRKMRWKLQILFFLTIHFSSKSDTYLIIYDPLKIKFLEKFLEFSMKIQLFRSAFEAYFQVKFYSFEHISSFLEGVLRAYTSNQRIPS